MRDRVRILCYHGTWLLEDLFPGDSMFIRRKTFADRLDYLKRSGFNVISLDRALQGSLPPDSVVITIDDGWYSTYRDMIPALKAADMPATIYCDTGNLLERKPLSHLMVRYLKRIFARPGMDLPEADEAFAVATDLSRTPAERLDAMQRFAALLGIDLEPFNTSRIFEYMTETELRHVQSDGFSVELHTHGHSLHAFEPEKVTNEIELNRQELSQILDKPPSSFRHFCFPSGITDSRVLATLRSLDIGSATTLSPFIVAPNADPLSLPRLLDGEHLSSLDFEAEVCGLGHVVRTLRRAVS